MQARPRFNKRRHRLTQHASLDGKKSEGVGSVHGRYEERHGERMGHGWSAVQEDEEGALATAAWKWRVTRRRVKMDQAKTHRYSTRREKKQ